MGIVRITFNDFENSYKQTHLEVEVAENINVNADIGYSCTTKEQAIKVAKYVAFCELIQHGENLGLL